jgi:ferredoxin
MKPLGGGHLIGRRKEALRYIMNLREAHSVAIGMQSKEEIDYNVQTFAGIAPQEDLAATRERRLLIHDWCEGCGRCIGRCGQGALRLEEGQAQVEMQKCVLCGYCAAVCPQFCIKVI